MALRSLTIASDGLLRTGGTLPLIIAARGLLDIEAGFKDLVAFILFIEQAKLFDLDC